MARLAHDLQQLLMSLAIGEIRRVDIPVWVAMRCCHVIGQCGSHRNLNPFKRIHYQQSQFAIEYVEVKNVIKFCTVAEHVTRSPLLERNRVGREPKVADVLEVAHHAVAIRHV